MSSPGPPAPGSPGPPPSRGGSSAVRPGGRVSPSAGGGPGRCRPSSGGRAPSGPHSSSGTVRYGLVSGFGGRYGVPGAYGPAPAPADDPLSVGPKAPAPRTASVLPTPAAPAAPLPGPEIFRG
ncbi:hypothetical protein SHIRM173S_12933 [Streptomyces hirsutus]